VNLKHLGNLNFLGNQFWDLTSAPLTKLQYLFSRSISGIFVQAAHKNYCTRGACSKNAIKRVIYVAYGNNQFPFGPAGAQHPPKKSLLRLHTHTSFPSPKITQDEMSIEPSVAIKPSVQYNQFPFGPFNSQRNDHQALSCYQAVHQI
jgi:hypothetical protein